MVNVPRIILASLRLSMLSQKWTMSTGNKLVVFMRHFPVTHAV